MTTYPTRTAKKTLTSMYQAITGLDIQPPIEREENTYFTETPSGKKLEVKVDGTFMLARIEDGLWYSVSDLYPEDGASILTRLGEEVSQWHEEMCHEVEETEEGFLVAST